MSLQHLFTHKGSTLTFDYFWLNICLTTFWGESTQIQSNSLDSFLNFVNLVTIIICTQQGNLDYFPYTNSLGGLVSTYSTAVLGIRYFDTFVIFLTLHKLIITLQKWIILFDFWLNLTFLMQYIFDGIQWDPNITNILYYSIIAILFKQPRQHKWWLNKFAYFF